MLRARGLLRKLPPRYGVHLNRRTCLLIKLNRGRPLFYHLMGE
jgi:hypothetical protein